MKTSKLAVLVTVVAVMFAGLTASAGNWKIKGNDNKTIQMSLEQAVQIPDLVDAMNEQLAPPDVPPLDTPLTLYVDYNGYTVSITGTYEQWMSFFRHQNINAPSLKTGGINIS